VKSHPIQIWKGLKQIGVLIILSIISNPMKNDVRIKKRKDIPGAVSWLNSNYSIKTLL
jgi:hypothetical protein